MYIHPPPRSDINIDMKLEYTVSSAYVNLEAGQFLKGIVRRKLWWVEIIINRQVLLYCWDAGHFFFNFKGTPSRILQKTFCRHLSLNYW